MAVYQLWELFINGCTLCTYDVSTQQHDKCYYCHLLVPLKVLFDY